jgi:2,4-dienoyl-CoA reductase-like NADH-dependent reductase (Old Yellow Enzyme family)
MPARTCSRQPGWNPSRCGTGSSTFEGAAPGALVSQRLIDFHTAVGRGGVGMSTVPYLAVAPDGRTERDQIYWRPEALAGLAKLTGAVHGTGAKISAQIGHAGPVANGQSNGLPGISPSRRFNPLSMRPGRCHRTRLAGRRPSGSPLESL